MGMVVDSADGVVITVTTSTGTPVLTDTLSKDDNGSWFSGSSASPAPAPGARADFGVTNNWGYEQMTDDIQDGGLDRRSVLRRGAILGGAMVWTVPTVQSLAGPAFAIGTAEICQVILAGRVDAYGTFTETSSAGVVRNDRTARVDLYDQESFDINSEVTGQHVLVQSRNAANTAAVPPRGGSSSTRWAPPATTPISAPRR